MDLLHQRYASPFSFLDRMIESGRFDEFIIGFYTAVNKEKSEKLEWEFFLHKVYDKSFNEFREENKTTSENQNMSSQTIEDIINQSKNIMRNFNPERGENN